MFTASSWSTVWDFCTAGVMSREGKRSPLSRPRAAAIVRPVYFLFYFYPPADGEK